MSCGYSSARVRRESQTLTSLSSLGMQTRDIDGSVSLRRSTFHAPIDSIQSAFSLNNRAVGSSPRDYVDHELELREPRLAVLAQVQIEWRQRFSKRTEAAKQRASTKHGFSLARKTMEMVIRTGTRAYAKKKKNTGGRTDEHTQVLSVKQTQHFLCRPSSQT